MPRSLPGPPEARLSSPRPQHRPAVRPPGEQAPGRSSPPAPALPRFPAAGVALPGAPHASCATPVPLAASCPPSRLSPLPPRLWAPHLWPVWPHWVRVHPRDADQRHLAVARVRVLPLGYLLWDDGDSAQGRTPPSPRPRLPCMRQMSVVRLSRTALCAGHRIQWPLTAWVSFTRNEKQ